MKIFLNWCKRFLFNYEELRLIFVKEFPKTIKSNYIYIEGDIDEKDLWYAKFKCPCGCGDILTLNLMEEDPPYWKVHLSKKFSLTPSIQRKIKCRSHFWITNSKVNWCKD